MGIISIIGLAWEAIQLIISIISFIRKLKKDDPEFEVSAMVKRVNEGIEDSKKTKRVEKLRQLDADLRAEWKRRKEGVGVGPDTKGLG